MSHNDSVLDEVGIRLGNALQDRERDQRRSATFDIERVVAGATRRRLRRARTSVAVVCAVLVGVAGVALTSRQPDPPPVQDMPAVSPSLLQAYALLADGDGVEIPFAMGTRGPGDGTFGAMPAIDVWSDGASTLVVRTVHPLPAVVDDTDVTVDTPTTTAGEMSSSPWQDRDVVIVTVRGETGAIEQLTDDQFAVWIPEGGDNYTLVFGRQMTRAQVLAEVEALAQVDGRLQPASGFTLVEQAPAAPEGAVTPGAYAYAVYGVKDGSSIVTIAPPAGRGSLELGNTSDVGYTAIVDGRTVMVADQYGSTSVVWVDSRGVFVGVYRTGVVDDVAALVRSVRMVSESEWIATSDRLSASVVADFAEDGRATIDGITLVHRVGDGDIRGLCLSIDGSPEHCAVSDVGAEDPESVTAQTEIDGHWFVYGHRQVLPDETVAMDDIGFTGGDGSCCDVQWIEQDGVFWYLVRIDDGLDTVDTNFGEVIGGMVGSISRPLTPSGL